MNNETTERKPDVVTIGVNLIIDQGTVKCDIVGTMDDNASKATAVIAKTVARAIQDTTKSTLEDIKAIFEFAQDVAEGDVAEGEVAEGEVTHE